MKINLYSPGPVRTAMRAQAMPGENPSTLPTAEDIAPQIVSLCSPDYQDNGEIISKR